MNEAPVSDRGIGKFVESEKTRWRKYKSFPDLFIAIKEGLGKPNDKKLNLDTGKGAIPLDIIMNPNKTAHEKPGFL